MFCMWVRLCYIVGVETVNSREKRGSHTYPARFVDETENLSELLASAGATPPPLIHMLCVSYI